MTSIDNAFDRGDIYSGRRPFTDLLIEDWRAMFLGERNGRYTRTVSWSDAPRELLDEILRCEERRLATLRWLWEDSVLR